MSSISPQESQYFKEYVTPFQPIGRIFYGADLRGTQCDRRGNGNLRLVGYGDSSGGYAFSPDNQDAAIAPSLLSANLSNISGAIPRYTEQQDMAGKWIDTITLHALDEFIEQVEPQSFAPNTFRIFAGGQKGYRGDGTGRPNGRNTYTLLAEVPIPALSRADIPRSFSIKLGVYIPPAQNIYLGLALPQPYTCSFEMWDLQANTLVGDGISSSLGGSPTVGDGNELSDSDPNPPVDTQFVLPIRFATATWRLGSGAIGQFPQPLPPPPSTVPPLGGGKPIIGGGGGGGSPSSDGDPSQPPTGGGSSPTSPTPKGAGPVPPPAEGGCTPIQDCNWYSISSAQSASVDLNLNGGTNLCPAGTVARGVVDFATSGSFILCCGAATYPPNDLGCSGTPTDKWSCSAGGVCIPDVLGIYNSQAECEAALVQPNFTGGQCTGIQYRVEVRGVLYYNDGTGRTQPFASFTWVLPGELPVGIADVYAPIASIQPGIFQNPPGRNVGVDVSARTVSGAPTTVGIFVSGVTPTQFIEVTAARVTRLDGLPDNCGNPTVQCP